IVIVLETLRMGKEHDADGKCTQTALVCVHHFTGTANRATAMTNTELCRHHQDVLFLLLVVELLENGHGFGGLTELSRTKFTFTVVVKRTVSGLIDQVEHLLHRLVVSWSNLFPP